MRLLQRLSFFFFSSSFSPFSVWKRLCSFPATILSVHLISLEAGNQITLNYKVIKGHLKSSLSKKAPEQQHHRGPGVQKIMLNSLTHAKMSAPKETRRIYLIDSAAVHLLNRATAEGQQSLLALVRTNNTLFCTLSLHEEHEEKRDVSGALRGGFIFSIIGSNPDSLCQIITLSPQNRSVACLCLANKTELQLRRVCDVHRWSMDRLSH